jgi:hypothetical protein
MANANSNGSNNKTGRKRDPESGKLLPTHGGRGWLEVGTVPAGKEWVLEVAGAIKRDYISDLVSDPSELTAGQVILLGLIGRQLIYLLLIDSWIMDNGGPIQGGGHVQEPMGKLYLSMANSISRNVEKLGMKRVGPSDDLETYIRRHYPKAPPSGSSGEGIARPGGSCEAGGVE